MQGSQCIILFVQNISQNNTMVYCSYKDALEPMSQEYLEAVDNTACSLLHRPKST